MALSAKDQKLYAEIIYSQLITRADRMADNYQLDYLFCALTEKPYDYRFFLFVSGYGKLERGDLPGVQLYELGREFKTTDAQHDALEEAVNGEPQEEFDIYATMNPARDVGGDFYDFRLLDDNKLYLAIADVSGKGIPAALFMMASMISLWNSVKSGKSPAQILAHVNDSICETNPEEMFVTVWIGILDLRTGKLTDAFVRNAEQFDDLTMLCLTYHGKYQT